MKLPFFSKIKPSIQRDYFYSLEIDHHQIRSAVWVIANAKPHVLSFSNLYEWDDTTIDSLVTACDKSLTDASAKSDPTGKILPSKVILGLPPDWISQDKINSDKISLLKDTCRQLSLDVKGYVTTCDAVITLLSQNDKVSSSAILIGVYPRHLVITLSRLGKVEGSSTIIRSSSSTDDVIEGITRFGPKDVLPSRIILYGLETIDLEKLKQHLLNFPWQAPQTHLPFLHFPKIDLLSPDYSVQAISLAGGQEISGTEFSAPDVPMTDSQTTRVVSNGDTGFVADIDVAALPVTPGPEPEPELEPETGTEVEITPSRDEIIPFENKTAPDFVAKRQSKPRFKIRVPQFNLPVGGKAFLTLPIIALVAIIAILMYVSRSSIVLQVATQDLTQQFDLLADQTISAVSSDPPAIPAKFKQTTVTQEDTITTTGSKLVGDKASGEVTIINGTSVPKTIPAQTILTSPSGLKFQTLSDVSVASASGSADPNSYQPGKANVKVAASQIGTESNLTAGTQFKVGTFASLDFIAKNDQAFSGGTSRQVQAVAKADLDALRNKLQKSILEKATTQLNSDVTASDILITSSLKLSASSEQFNHKLDDISDNLTLKLSSQASAAVIAKSDLDMVVSQQITSHLPSGFRLESTPTSDFSFKSSDSTKVSLSVTVKAKLLPETDFEAIKKRLSGEKLSTGIAYLKSLPQVSQVSVTLFPPIPQFLASFPRRLNNIAITVRAAP